MFGHPKALNPYADKHESLNDAYATGWNHGHGIACHNVPTIGETVWTEYEGRVTIDAENIRDVHQDFCYQAAENGKQYSPFEFTANEFNKAEDGDEENPSADELWEAFEEGVSDAIAADLATYTDADYGMVRADNAHEALVAERDELVAALKNALHNTAVGDGVAPARISQGAVEAMRAALAKAGAI